MLSQLSPVLNKLLHDPLADAKQEGDDKKDAVDTGETDPALYHDFLLALTAPTLLREDVLPNRKNSNTLLNFYTLGQNIAGMIRLADYYDVPRLLDQCERHLLMCREMPAEERIVLAKKFGSTKMQVCNSILNQKS